MPLVPRDGARVVRERAGRVGDESPVRQRQGRPGGTARRRRRLHGGGAGADRTRRLADDRVPRPRRSSLLRGHVLPRRRSPGHARARSSPRGGPQRVGGAARRGTRPGRADARLDRPHHSTRCGRGFRRHRPAGPRAAGAGGHHDRAPVRRRPRRFRERTEVSPGDDAHVPRRHGRSRSGSRGRRARDRAHDHTLARRDGRGRPVRPGRWWLPPLLGGRSLARAPLREDALRPSPARSSLPPGLAPHARRALPRGRRGNHRVRAPRPARRRGIRLRRRR